MRTLKWGPISLKVDGLTPPPREKRLGKDPCGGEIGIARLTTVETKGAFGSTAINTLALPNQAPVWYGHVWWPAATELNSHGH